MKKRNLFQKIMSLLNICCLLYLQYMLFVRPHLNSATPVRDISRNLVAFVAPIILMMCLLFWGIIKIKKSNENKMMENKSPINFPINWNETIPPETMRVIWKILAVCLLVGVVGLPMLFVGFGWLARFLFG